MKNKKGISWVIIVGIVLLAIIVLIVISRFFVFWMWYPEPEEINPDLGFDEEIYSPSYEEPEIDEPPKEYKKSDRLSEISFKRVINEERLQANFDITVKGYVEEVESVSGVYGERYFALSDAIVIWEADARETSDRTNCFYEYTLSGAGEDEAANLDVMYGDSAGKDAEGNWIHLDGWGDIVLAYNSYGYAGDGKPEVSFNGEVLIPVDYVESVTVTKPSEHISAICNGFTESTTLERDGTFQFAFPLIIPAGGGDGYEGNALLKEMDFDASGDARLDSILLASTGALTIIPDDNLWEVGWKVYLP
jgi:hypothetical protein